MYRHSTSRIVQQQKPFHVWFLLYALLLLGGTPQAAFPDLHNQLLQFTAAGHVLGFQSDGLYVASGDHMLHVGFVGAAGVVPEAAVASKETHRAQPLTQVTYTDLWPGVSLHYTATAKGIAESTWEIATGGDANQIRLRYNAPVEIAADGGLQIQYETGWMRESPPIAWQMIDGRRSPVAVSFHVLEASESEPVIGLRVGQYDTAHPLLIDPTLEWNTFMGTSKLDSGSAITVDAGSNVYVAGVSEATWGTPVNAYAGFYDAFAAKLSPLMPVSDTIVLNKEGPKTAYQGDLIEYTLGIENSGTTIIEGAEVLDTLPSEVDFLDSTPTAGGVYNPGSGIWTLPTLGTGEDDKAAGLKIQALVRTDLNVDPAGFVTAKNLAEVVLPVPPEPILAEVATYIVCASCIDWEILSVEPGYEDKFDDDKYRSKYLYYVRVANNGPVMSEATVTVTHFNISGGGYGNVTLKPSMPVAVTLDAGETQVITYTTGWVNGADSDYTITWEFEVSDVSLLDPISPNTVSGSFTGDVKGSSSGGGGCSINKEAATDPVWLFLLILTSIWCRKMHHITK